MFKIEDLRYLFKNAKVESKDIYRQDLKRNHLIVNQINEHNKNFSNSVFISWVSNVFQRYILFCSSKDNGDRLVSFEKIHLSNGINPIWHNSLDIYNKYKDIKVKYIDFIDYTHTEENDFVLLKICLLCTINNESDIDEVDLVFYNIKFNKNNKEIKDIDGLDFTSNCPNCGAPTRITTFGVCDHCQELISIYDNVWKIVNISVDE